MHRIPKVGVAMLAIALGLLGCDDGGPDGPSAPANVIVQVQSPTRIRVTWNASSGATSYVIERAQGATGGTFAEVGTSNTTQFEDATLSPGTVYRYRVAAVTGTNRSVFSNEVQGTTQQPGTVVINADITVNRTLSRDTIYILNGFIHVQAPATLTIESGTTIKGDFETVGSSLFIMRGAKILAIGSAAQPIVFTSEQPVGQRRSGDWGGLILIGNATINRTGVINLEGTTGTTGNPFVNYGQGTNDSDDSGELRYVRVEFAGYAPADAQELNSFTFAALGSATRLSYLQSMGGLDDSFEWFGGTADAKYLVSYNSGDDHFDMAEGFRGRLQYLIAFQSNVTPAVRPGLPGGTSTDPVGIENDGCNGAGCTNGNDSAPLTIPLVANFTLIGTGAGTWVDPTGGGYGMVLRRGTGGFYVNGAVARWPKAALAVRDASTGTRLTNGDLIPRNILISQDNPLMFQAGQQTVDAVANAIIQGTEATATLFTAVPLAPANAAALDFTPSAASALLTGGLATFTGAIATKAGTFVTATAFRGAAPIAGPDLRWWAGWTNYAVN